ncbi:ATP-binding protein [Streptomyces sp. CRN 30]|uniref:ATP-binding protein n=1 Tax=Streptomyces sp. CRN 30 TaxID=3075613 RepID=UPI002A830384|nr:ATP-binding protein [Streptomyces sp. CRN 30]
MRPGSPRLSSRLTAAREQAFIGRSHELSRFRAVLAADPTAPSVLYVHGPGGVGKSALLRRCADEALAAGRPVVRVDGRRTDPSPTGFALEAGAAGTDVPAVLLVDAFEHCQGLEDWLRETFLPELPVGSAVVVASRLAPTPHWVHDAAWQGILEVLPLAALDRDDARTLLARRGVPENLRDAVSAFAGGHPLALSLAASVALTESSTADDWAPTPDVITALLTSLVGELPAGHERLALETAAHTLVTTEGLLRSVVGEEHAARMFSWLRGLPYAELGRHGLFLHETAAEVIDRDLRWRDAQGYERMHREVGHHLLQRAQTAPEEEAMAAIRALTHLKRYGPMGPYFTGITREGDVYEAPLLPGDHDTVVAMTEETEGARSARIVAHWLERHPEGFWGYRSARTGELVAFMTWLRLTVPGEGAEEDPVAAAAWRHVAAVAPLRPGQHLLMSRFMVYPADYGGISTVGHLMQLRICRDWIRSRGLAWSFIVSPDAALWDGLMHHLGHRQVAETGWDNGRVFTTYGCDWRVTPLEIWFDRTQPGALHSGPPGGAPEVPVVALDGEEFRAAVRDALRSVLRPTALEGSPLLRTRLLAERAALSETEPTDVLRSLLAEAVERLKDEPEHRKARQALYTTYFQRVRTQQGAAQRLGLPFSTYRRHLAQGTALVCDALWERERALGALD